MWGEGEREERLEASRNKENTTQATKTEHYKNHIIRNKRKFEWKKSAEIIHRRRGGCHYFK